jgi:hypothetical protein
MTKASSHEFPFFFGDGFDEPLKKLINDNRDKVTCKMGPLACQNMAWAWVRFLKKEKAFEDYQLEVVDGFYIPDGDPDNAEGHTWLEFEGVIFDPTAAQFNVAGGDYEPTDRHEVEASVSGFFGAFPDANAAASVVSAKFMNDSTAVCLYCKGKLAASSVVQNKQHAYTIGTLFECPCGKSKVWTNSIRNPKKFLAFISGEAPRYTNGFCNDKFCGFTFDDDQLRVLEGGIEVPGFEQRAERLGNPKTDNDQMAWWFGNEDGEAETQSMVDWYRTHKDEVTKLAGVVSAARQSLTTVYHVGDLSKPRKKPGSSYEGSGLSVSLDPKEWARIAQLGGPTFSLTNPKARFLAASSSSHKKAVAWAQTQGWIRPKEWFRVSHGYDEELEDETFTDLDTREAALEEAGDEESIKAVTGFAFDKKGEDYWREAFTSEPQHGLAEDFAILWFAEAQGYDGVWWNDSHTAWTAPRGVIFQSKLGNWQVKNLHPAGLSAMMDDFVARVSALPFVSATTKLALEEAASMLADNDPTRSDLD